MPLVNVRERLGRPTAITALDGEEAVYVVGGAVRDVLLGRAPRALRTAGSATGRRTGGLAGRGSRAAGLHRQRDRAPPGRRRAHLLRRRARGPRGGRPARAPRGVVP